MKISFSLSGFTKGVKYMFDVNSLQFRHEMIGKPIYLDRYKYLGIITDLDPKNDLIYAEIPDKEYKELILDANGYNRCSFEIIKE